MSPASSGGSKHDKVRTSATESALGIAVISNRHYWCAASLSDTADCAGCKLPSITLGSSLPELYIGCNVHTLRPHHMFSGFTLMEAAEPCASSYRNVFVPPPAWHSVATITLASSLDCLVEARGDHFRVWKRKSTLARHRVPECPRRLRTLQLINGRKQRQASHVDQIALSQPSVELSTGGLLGDHFQGGQQMSTLGEAGRSEVKSLSQGALAGLAAEITANAHAHATD